MVESVKEGSEDEDEDGDEDVGEDEWVAAHRSSIPWLMLDVADT